jgi:hypothetical protein
VPSSAMTAATGRQSLVPGAILIAAPGSGDPVWLRFVNSSEIAVAEAKGQMYLGAPEAAVRLYEQSLTDDGLSPRNRVNYRAQLAAALAATGDQAAAVDPP